MGYHDKKIIRLDNRDYSWSGDYFVTICTQLRECYLGEIINKQMVLSAVGGIAKESWMNIPNHFKNVILGPFVVMPNHMHGIITINNTIVHQKEENLQVGNKFKDQISNIKLNKFSRPVTGSLSVIISNFKSSVTRWCNKNKHAYFAWQPRFHERVIRDSSEYDRISQYIHENTSHWDDDEYRH